MSSRKAEGRENTSIVLYYKKPAHEWTTQFKPELVKGQLCYYSHPFQSLLQMGP